MSEFLDPSEKIQKHGAKLPHWQQSDSMQCVTFRLGDAMIHDMSVVAPSSLRSLPIPETIPPCNHYCLPGA